jgi:hypothetical protein
LIAVVHVGIASELATYFIDVDNCQSRITTGIRPDPLTAHRPNPLLVFPKRVVFSRSHGLVHTAIGLASPRTSLARYRQSATGAPLSVALAVSETFGDGGTTARAEHQVGDASGAQPRIKDQDISRTALAPLHCQTCVECLEFIDQQQQYRPGKLFLQLRVGQTGQRLERGYVLFD